LLAHSAAIAADDDKTVTTKLSGQINRGLLYADNGTDTDVIHVDNDNSSTRFRFTGDAVFNDRNRGESFGNSNLNPTALPNSISIKMMTARRNSPSAS
jgi:hypothetical protein